MAILQTCCCWRNVRSGTFASGFYTLIFSLITGGYITLTLLQLEGNTASVESHTIPIYGTYFKAALAWFITTLVLSVLLFVSSIILLIAVQQDIAFLMLPWMVAAVLLVVTDTAMLIFECVLFGMLTLNIVQMVVWLALTLVNIYSILCVISQYQDLRDGRGSREYHQQQRPMIMYQPAIQQVHLTQGPIMVALPATLSGNMSTPSVQLCQQSSNRANVTSATLTMITPPDYNLVNDLPRYSVATGIYSPSTDPCPEYKHTDDNVKPETNTDVLLPKDNPPPDYQP